MRPMTKLTIFAIVAAAMAAPAYAAADYFLKLGPIKGEVTDRILNPVPRDAGKQIAITSWSWGATRKARVATLKSDLSTGKLGSVGEMRDADASTAVSSPRDAASGMPTGKRQHGPVTISKPYEAGSMTFRGVVTGCAGGTTYRDATLVTPTHKYEFEDVFITSCATAGGGGAPPIEEVSFNYAKVTVRGWNPEKKEP